MPGGYRTGPPGQGPRSGRGLGRCGEATGGGLIDRPALDLQWRGPSPAGPGRGHGYRRRFYATGVPFCGPARGQSEALPPQEELDLLRGEATRLRSVLEGIDRRLAELEVT